jgi:hypothetical protein
MPGKEEPLSVPDLPFIDRRCVAIAAPDERIWAALGEVLEHGFGGLGIAQLAHVLGTSERSIEGARLSMGSTIVGFRVIESDAPHKVVLAGRHRFSRYLLAIEIEDGVLCATTRAEFPGLHGSAYKALVIGSGAHVVSMRRILTKVKRRAEATARCRARYPGLCWRDEDCRFRG